MPVGPFDRRTRRSRCTQCALSHTKCSGQYPCSRCQKRGAICSFPASAAASLGTGPNQVIVLDRGRHLSPNSFDLANSKAASPQRLLPDKTVRYLQYFDLFIQRNNFTGKDVPFLTDVQDLSKASRMPGQQSDGSHLLNAMLALGAVQASSMGALRPHADLQFALNAYAKSITHLRTAVSEPTAKTEASILWSTFFLGLFELMQDPSGQRWLQHMVFGTSRALTAIGPSRIKHGPLRTFFTQIRAFEVCRSVIFNESSFLASPEWIDTARDLSLEQLAGAESLPHEILEIVVLCANLRVRTAEFIDSMTASPHPCELPVALALAQEGFDLRQALDDWSIKATLLDDPSPEMLLATSYHAATSIYLSGNFDYDSRHWQDLDIIVPVLTAEDVSRNFDTIIQATTSALKTTALSPVLFMFPLRVAGARAHQRWQQEAVSGLLNKVKERFLAADAFLNDLKKLWASR